MTTPRTWEPGCKCCYPGCPMTLCTPVDGSKVCWLHVLFLGLPVALLDPEPARR